MAEVFRFGDAVLDTHSGRLFRGGEPLALEPRTFDVLLYLLQRPGQLVRHEELLDEIWRDTHVTAHSLTQAISQIRHALNDAPHQPRFIQTVHRRGYQWIGPVERIVPPSDRMPASAEPWSVPAAVTQLIGRDSLIESIETRILESRVVTLIGPGGVGKTQVALEVARRSARLFADGALFVDMTSEGDASGVNRALARSMRIEPGEGSPSVGALAEVLRDRHGLLLFDNCEHMTEAVSALISAILAASARVRVLVTTQRPLNAPGQVLARVPPLGLPPAGWSPADSPDPTVWPSSVQLFSERARAVSADFVVTEQNAAAVVSICRSLDGIPLALELAAARTNVLTPWQIAERLDQRLRLLTSRHPSAQARHHTLHATVEWSVSLLSERAQRVLEEMAVFAGGWTLEAAEAVAATGREPLDDLAALIDRSLVTVDMGRPVARYGMLDSIRLYAQERLSRSPGQTRIRDRHLQHFGAFAAEVERHISADPLPWLRRVREEHANLREAFLWAVADSRHANDSLRLCCNLRWAWRLEGNYLESREWLMHALANAPHADPSLLGRAWIVLGLIQHHRGELGVARQAVDQGLGLLPADERWERGFGSVLRAYIETMRGNVHDAESFAEEAEDVIAPLGDPLLEGFALVRKGMAAGLAHKHDLAAQLMEEASERLERSNDRFLSAFSKLQLGLQRYLGGQVALAREGALAIIREGCALDNLRMISGGIELCAYLKLQQGEIPMGARLLGASARLRQITGAPILSNFAAANEQARAQAVALLGPDVAEQEIQLGANTPLAEVINTVTTALTGPQ